MSTSKIWRLKKSGPLFNVYKNWPIHTKAGVSSPPTLDLSSVILRSDSIRNYLFQLGYEKVRFYAYQKLSHLTVKAGGGFIKTVVSDLSSFVKREWATESDLFQRVCNIMPIPETQKVPEPRRFFISLGGMLLNGKEHDVENLTEELLQLYMRNVQQDMVVDSAMDKDQRAVLKIVSRYYRYCRINYRKLYDPKVGRKSFQIGERTFSIELPSLPQISSKQLLARALLHKELYRALILPGHPVFEQLASLKSDMGISAGTVVRYDLSFLDGLGDLLIASESCQFLYNFRMLHPYVEDSTFGKKTFTLLKNTLGTNTLLSRLAILYNMHLALEDPMVSHMLQTSYIPQTFSSMAGTDTGKSTYEEEFLADYFEQYVGALFLDSPEVAKTWLNELFERILSSISDGYKIPHKQQSSFRFDYRAWSMDVVGRPLSF